MNSWQMAQINGQEDDEPLPVQITNGDAVKAYAVLSSFLDGAGLDRISKKRHREACEAFYQLWDYIVQLEERIEVMTPDPEPPSEDEINYAMMRSEELANIERLSRG